MNNVNYIGDLPLHVKAEAQKNSICLQEVEVGSEFYLIYEERKLCFLTQDMKERKEWPIVFDFEKLLQHHRRKAYLFSKEPFAKALGRRELKNNKVIDLTCGSGQDTILMYAFGVKKIDAFERNPYIYLLLFDACMRSNLEGIQLYYGDFLEDDKWDIVAETLYFDPMYELPGKRKALPRKEMRIFHELLINEGTIQKTIFDKFEKDQFKRLIIKRPLKGDCYLDRSPSMSFKGKSTRYDVYIK